MSQWITIIWNCARFCFPHFLANIYIDLDRNYFFHTNDNATNEKLLNEGLFEFKLFMCMMCCIFNMARGHTGVQEKELQLYWLDLLGCKHPIHYYLCSGHRDLELAVAFVNTQNNLHKKYWKPVFSWRRNILCKGYGWVSPGPRCPPPTCCWSTWESRFCLACWGRHPRRWSRSCRRRRRGPQVRVTGWTEIRFQLIRSNEIISSMYMFTLSKSIFS